MVNVSPVRPCHFGGLGLIGVVWLTTVFVQIPLHRRLALAHDPALIRRLVRGNWLRTFAWTARGLLVTTALNVALPV